jgi:hypothetical protein
MMRLGDEFWEREPLNAIQLLADLRTFVLERSHRRLPRWYFRLAPDLVVRLQPRPAEQRDRFALFYGDAFEGQGITRAVCVSAAQCREGAIGRLRFLVTQGPCYVGDPPGWTFRPMMIWRRAVSEPTWPDTFRARVIAALRPESFASLTAQMMLSPACLIRGKALTDPVSIARWIGPECAGTGSLDVRPVRCVREAPPTAPAAD